MSVADSDPWYRDGLAFDLHPMRGNCCTGAPGLSSGSTMPRRSPELAEYRGRVGRDAFALGNFVRRVDHAAQPDRAAGGRLYLLGPHDPVGCTVYSGPARPVPDLAVLAREHRHSTEDWEHVVTSICPGSGRGQLFQRRGDQGERLSKVHDLMTRPRRPDRRSRRRPLPRPLSGRCTTRSTRRSRAEATGLRDQRPVLPVRGVRPHPVRLGARVRASCWPTRRRPSRPLLMTGPTARGRTTEGGVRPARPGRWAAGSISATLPIKPRHGP